MARASPAAVASGRYAALDNDDEDDDDDDPKVPATMAEIWGEDLEEGWQNAITQSLESEAARRATADAPAPSGKATARVLSLWYLSACFYSMELQRDVLLWLRPFP